MKDEEKTGEELLKEVAGLSRCIDELVKKEAQCRRSEEETRLLKDVIISIYNSEDFDAALFAVLEKICSTTDWVYGEAWLPHPGGKFLERGPLWYSKFDGFGDFTVLSEGFRFPPGKGLPGRVWSSKRPVWIKDVTLDSNFPRAQIAAKVGFKAGVAVPILARDEVVAVMAFYMFAARPEDERFIELVSAVAAQLGMIIRRKRAEDALRQSEEHFRTLIENSSDLISILSRDGVMQYISPSHEKILGYKSGELTEKDAFEFIHIDDLQMVKEAFVRVIENPFEIQAVGFRFRHKDGSWRFLESIGKCLAEDSMMRVIVNSRDTTERKKMEESLARSEEYYRSIFESSRDCICHISLDGKYLNMNPAGLTINELDSLERVIGKSSTASITENRAAAEEAIRRAASGEAVALQYKSVSRKGKGIWWDSIVAPIRGADGSVRSILRISRDVTERYPQAKGKP